MADLDTISLAIEHLRRSGPLSAAELSSRLGVSRPTLTRAFGHATDRVVKIGGGRSSRYALPDPRFRERCPIPIHRVDSAGAVETIAELTLLDGGSVWVNASSSEPWILAGSDRGLFEDLPYYVFDQRPQGYLGRIRARGLPGGWPNDINLWQSHHILEFLLAYGADSSGDLVVGSLSGRNLDLSEKVDLAQRGTTYDRMAENALASGVPGSSAAGERPKFVVKLAGSPGGSVEHAIVKFSPVRDTAVGRRWSDLLICEHVALSVLSQAGWPAAQTRIVQTDARTYIESIRFDRHGERGRSQSLSLDVIDSQLVGKQQSWTNTARELYRNGWLDEASLSWIARADYFGDLIANSDRHLGNISLRFADGKFRLCPLYDMAPMAFVPRDGEVVPFRPWPVSARKNDSDWEAARELAVRTWQAIIDEPNITDDFKIGVREQLFLILDRT